MIRVTVTYPSNSSSTFDLDYYKNKHIPMCQAVWSPLSAEINKGIDGPNVAAVHFMFDSLESFQAAMGSPKTGDVMADVPNYTNITPVIQVSEIV